ncbi:MAG: TraB/GumN family protein [Nanoarchaeota archaeon]|nr:TraB/GumN family protein [Nanoarchaeota archaeon]
MNSTPEHLKIIGTSHIAKESVEEIKKAIEEWKPEIVAVELDVRRAFALMQKEKTKTSIRDALKIGLKGYLFVKIGQYVQEKLGNMVGVSPGSEMKTALEMAKKNNLKIAFIDQPIEITLKKFSKNLTWKEKFRFVGDIFAGIFTPKRQIKKLNLNKFDLTKVPDQKTISSLIKQLDERYPNVYKTLITDRNKYMIKELVKLLRDNKEQKILVVVGAGHQEGMEKLLLKVEVV